MTQLNVGCQCLRHLARKRLGLDNALQTRDAGLKVCLERRYTNVSMVREAHRVDGLLRVLRHLECPEQEGRVNEKRANDVSGR